MDKLVSLLCVILLTASCSTSSPERLARKAAE